MDSFEGEKPTEVTSEERYNSVVEKIQNVAMKLASAERAERAGEKATQRLLDKVRQWQGELSEIEAIEAIKELPPLYSIEDIIAEYEQDLEKLQDVAPTGIPSLDKILGGGLESKTVVMLLGAPGQGKTALANQIAYKVASQERPVVYLTSEENRKRLLSKTIARIGKINYSMVRRGDKDYLPQIRGAFAEYGEQPGYNWLRYLDITDHPYNMAAIERSVSAYFEQKPGKGLLIVDYLQNLARIYGGNEAEMRHAVGNLARKFRDIAMHLDCCVIVLGAQSRESIKASPTLDNILTSGKESGEIEYAADVVLALAADPNATTRTDYETGVALDSRILFVPKSRLGERGSVPLDWCGAYQRFAELNEEDL